MTLLLRYLPHLLGAALLAWLAVSAYGWAYDNGYNAANVRAEKIIGEFHEAEKQASEQARKAEQARTEAVARAAAEYERGKVDGEKRAAGIVAGLKSGERRLRHEIAALHTERLSRDSAVAGELGETAQRGADLVGAAVGVGAACDAQVAGLIEAYEALRP